MLASRRLKIIALVACIGAGTAAPALAGGPQGRWITASGNVEVAVAPCGAALCGTIVRVLANHSMAHPGAATPALPGVGLKILTAVRPDGPGQWTGRLYNRETGKTYDCQLSVDAADRLVVRPYVLLPLLGQTQLWRRQP